MKTSNISTLSLPVSVSDSSTLNADAVSLDKPAPTSSVGLDYSVPQEMQQRAGKALVPRTGQTQASSCSKDQNRQALIDTNLKRGFFVATVIKCKTVADRNVPYVPLLRGINGDPRAGAMSPRGDRVLYYDGEK